MFLQLSPPRQTAHQFFAIVNALQILLRAALSFVLPLQPRLDALVLVVEVVHVGHQVLDDVHVRQRVDLGRLVTARVDLTVNKTQRALLSVSDQASNDRTTFCNVVKMLSTHYFQKKFWNSCTNRTMEFKFNVNIRVKEEYFENED